MQVLVLIEEQEYKFAAGEFSNIWGELGKRYLTSVGIVAKLGLAKILFPMNLDESSEYLKEAYSRPDSVEKITEDTIMILSDFYWNEAVPKEGVIDFIKEIWNLVIRKHGIW